MGAELNMDTMVRHDTTPPGEDRSGPPPGRGAAAGVWKVLGAILVVAGLLWGTYNVVTLLAHEARVETQTFAAADVSSLDIDNSSGTVRIVATDTDEISVRARISDGLRSTGEHREIVDGQLRLRATCPLIGSNFCDVTYDVVVPLDLPITIDAANGRVEVSGSTAPVAINADNGTVELTGLSGAIQAETDNGRLLGSGLRATEVRADTDNGRVELEFAVAPTNVVATSNNGSVTVVVPDDGETYQVAMQTNNGSENLEVPTDPSSTRVLELRTDNGSVTARLAP